jgi:hypothetical protein
MKSNVFTYTGRDLQVHLAPEVSPLPCSLFTLHLLTTATPLVYTRL